MATLEQIKDLISKEIAPLKLKLQELSKKYDDLTNSVQAMSNKHDDLLDLYQSSNDKLKRQSKDITNLKQDIKIVDMRANEALTDIDALAQYI